LATVAAYCGRGSVLHDEVMDDVELSLERIRDMVRFRRSYLLIQDDSES